VEALDGYLVVRTAGLNYGLRLGAGGGVCFDKSRERRQARVQRLEVNTDPCLAVTRNR